MGNNRRLKAFVRYDGSGRIIPGGPILSAKKPKVGNWKEINAYKCCNQTPLPSNCIEFVVDTTGNVFFPISFSSTTTDFDFTITWGDGNVSTGTTGEGSYSELHRYPVENTTYVARVCFSDISVVNSINFEGND